ncbi:MAG: M28 family peptidase [Gemmatimonadales bacterium]
MSRQFTTFLAISMLAAGCGAHGGSPPAREFDGKAALDLVVKQLDFGPRIPGTPGHAAMLVWLDSMARARSDTVQNQTWWHHAASGDSVQMTNVLAQFNPAATQRVLYLAHWDSRPHADRDSVNPTAPMPGADDGGSGVAILLGIADALKKKPPPADLGVDLLFVDGEDYGDFGPPMVDVLVGSTYYAQHPIAAKPLFAIVWDMVGHKNLQIPIEQYSQVAAPDVVDKVWNIADAMGYGHIFVRNSGGAIIDDHSPLIDAGFRAIDVIDINYPYWHTTQDTPDKESAQSLEAVGNVGVAVIRKARQ